MGIGPLHWRGCSTKRGPLHAEPAKPDLEPRQLDLTPQAAPGARAGDDSVHAGRAEPHGPPRPKPTLTKLADGQKFPGTIKYDNAAQASSKVLGSPWKFAKHGKCGTEVSELLPNLAETIDDICVVRSMKTGVNNHVQSIHALNGGRPIAGRPVVGSWLTYALGTESQNLPAFVALTDPASPPVAGADHWSNGWLPSLFQGTVVRPRGSRHPQPDPPRTSRARASLLEYLIASTATIWRSILASRT
jgi:hypothetical protein